jgi:hypothetical protein
LKTKKIYEKQENFYCARKNKRKKRFKTKNERKTL